LNEEGLNSTLQNSSKTKTLRVLRLFAVYSILALLLYFALRNAPLAEIWETIRQLKLWQIFALIGINAAIYALITLRWWVIVRAEAKSIPYVPLLAVRVAVFGVSYFTLGPQIGGEPLQVLYLRYHHGLTYTRAAASVVMDKLLEFLANFILLAVGLTAVAEAGIFSVTGGQLSAAWAALAALMLWPLIHIILMYRGVYPIRFVLRALSRAKWSRFIIAAERLAGAFCQRHLRALFVAAFVSLLAAAGMVIEYMLITSFLQIRLPFWQTVSAWTAGWLAFLVPLPGGLGALEASQVFALGAFGIAAASAIGVTLLMRARDILIGGLGLYFASRGLVK